MNPPLPPDIRLRLHGYPALFVGGRPVALKLRRGLALLALLDEVAPRPLGRQHLAAWLWPDVEAATGRARLRRLVHELHQAVGLAVVEGDADALRLVSACRSDLREAAVACAEAPAAHAVARLLAPGSDAVLEGFQLDSEAFDDWLAGRRRSHRAAVQRALERAADASDGDADPDAAHALATRLLELDDCSEAGHCARLRACALAGDAVALETAYHAAAQRLRDEFGVRPSARIEAAYAQAQGRLRCDAPSIDYADGGHGEVAHAAWGRGDAIVVLWGLIGNLDVAFDEPRARALLDRLARRHRVVMLDRRGTGLSERVGVVADAEEGARDIVTTLDHLGIERAWLFGSSVGGTIALDFALRHPDRTRGLLLFGTSACGAWAPEWPWALKREAFDDWLARLTDPAHYADSLRRFAPSVADDPALQAWYARLLRNAATRRGAAASLRAYQAMDLRRRVGALAAPALVMQRRGDRIVPFEAGRWLARALPAAEFAPLDGDDHFLWHGDAASVAERVEAFVASHAATDDARARRRPAALAA